MAGEIVAQHKLAISNCQITIIMLSQQEKPKSNGEDKS